MTLSQSLLATISSMWMRTQLHVNGTSAQTKYLKMSPLECRAKQSTNPGRHHLPLKRVIRSETQTKVIWTEIPTRKANRPRGARGREAATRQPTWYV